MHRHCAHGAGFEPGQVASILSENNKEWLFVDMATMCVGGISNGVYTTDSYSQLKHVCVDSQTRILFVEDEEQLDKFLEIEKELPWSKRLLFSMMTAQNLQPSKSNVHGRALRIGAKNLKNCKRNLIRVSKMCARRILHLGLHIRHHRTAQRRDAFHQNLLFQARNAGSWIGDEAREEIISILPLCHIAERTFSVFLPLNFKWIVNLSSRRRRVSRIRWRFPDSVFRRAAHVGENAFEYGD